MLSRCTQQVSWKENIVFTRNLNSSFTEYFEIRLRGVYDPVATVCIPLINYVELNLFFAGTVTAAFSRYVFNIVYPSLITNVLIKPSISE